VTLALIKVGRGRKWHLPLRADPTAPEDWSLEVEFARRRRLTKCGFVGEVILIDELTDEDFDICSRCAWL
jgi:hypothetical protein